MMEQQLKTLRERNQTLLLNLQQGQRDCHDMIRSLKSDNGEVDLISKAYLPSEDLPPKSMNVRIVPPSFEVEKARKSMNCKNKRLPQGIDESAKTENRTFLPLTETSKQFSRNEITTYSPVHGRTGTPKSILKRRKIVDDHVKVDSKYEHTPPYKSSLENKHLNFSYSDVDDLETAKARYRAKESGLESGSNSSADVSLDGSYLDKPFRDKTALTTEQQMPKPVDSIDTLLRERLLLDCGNDRKNAAVVEALKKRPKSILLNETQKETKQSKNFTLKGRSSSLDKSISKEMSSLLDSRSTDHPLLGYDWIAGILDNGPVLSDKSEDYFEAIKHFRRENREECIGSGELENVLDLTKPIEPEVQNPCHTCVHGFIINERLFPEAMNPDESGKNVCPVCLTKRPDPTNEDPGFVRVSIPRSTLMSPYRVRPHRRRSFDSTDSISLANHCMAGYECSKPSALPTASNLDLKHTIDGIKAKLTANESELDKLTQSFNRTSRTLSELQSLSQLDSTTDDLQRLMRKKTDDLMNTSHSLRFELQKMEKERNLEKPAPFSTAFPLY